MVWIASVDSMARVIAARSAMPSRIASPARIARTSSAAGTSGESSGSAPVNASQAVAFLFTPSHLENTLDRSLGSMALAGLMVGFGTALGSGCTSGHGVCGISRLSKRSLVATATFMVFGALTVFVVNHLLGGAV